MAGANKAMAALAEASQLASTVDEFSDDDTKQVQASARVSRVGYGRVPMYKLTPTGCVFIQVAVQGALETLKSPNYSLTCFDCGEDDCCAAPGNTINDCPGRPPRLFRICPITSCRKKVYDTQPTGKFSMDEFDNSDRVEDDPNAIKDDTYENSTPQTRTKAAMDMHLIGFHPAESSEMGVLRPREMPRLAVVS